jgi:hypothetical protein
VSSTAWSATHSVLHLILLVAPHESWGTIKLGFGTVEAGTLQ